MSQILEITYLCLKFILIVELFIKIPSKSLKKREKGLVVYVDQEQKINAFYFKHNFSETKFVPF